MNTKNVIVLSLLLLAACSKPTLNKPILNKPTLTCKDIGEGPIGSDDPRYEQLDDRDGDGLACE